MEATTSRQPAPALSIVIVSWNTREVLRNCLRSLEQHGASDGIEMVVVDNASGDGSPEMVVVDFPRVRLIRNDANLGFARACNQGMRVSHGELILLINSDTYVVDDVIERTARYLISRPEITMTACQLRFPDGRLQHTANRALGILRSLFEDLWLYKLVPDTVRNDILLGGFWDCDREKEVDWLAGVFLMLRRSAFLESGGFCEDFFMYGEDAEWCLRLRRAGHRITFNPLGVVYHIGSVSSDLEWSQRERLRLCHLGGVDAYRLLHGRPLAYLYAVARLLGSSVRWVAYTILSARRTNRSYYVAQRRAYGWLVGFYVEATTRRRTLSGGQELA
jgi:GT2 family glycosyltransferase